MDRETGLFADRAGGRYQVSPSSSSTYHVAGFRLLYVVDVKSRT
jgi:hypothetical protein